MATVLVDYENVSGSKGLDGIKYLTDKDTLKIFYSSSCMNISAEYMEEIIVSNCHFDIYKLKRPSKNALDFYIATEVGRVSSSGEKDIILISKDKGFSAIADYFLVNDNLKNSNIVISTDIAHGLKQLSSKNGETRVNLIQQKLKQVNIEVEYEKIKERNMIKSKIEELLHDTEYEKMSDNVIKFLENNKSAKYKKLYTGSLHEFGLRDGVGIYKLIKNIV